MGHAGSLVYVADLQLNVNLVGVESYVYAAGYRILK